MFKGLLSTQATHICDDSMVVRTWTSRCRARHRVLKGEPKDAPGEWLTRPVLPTAQQDGFCPYEVYVDPEIFDLFPRGRIEPAHELAERVAASDSVHGWPLDWRIFSVYGVSGGEERQHRVFG